jgi:hypothetical protein
MMKEHHGEGLSLVSFYHQMKSVASCVSAFLDSQYYVSLIMKLKCTTSLPQIRSSPSAPQICAMILSVAYYLCIRALWHLNLYINHSLGTCPLLGPSLLLISLEGITANLDNNVPIQGGLMIDRAGVCSNCVAHFRRGAGSPTSMPF